MENRFEGRKQDTGASQEATILAEIRIMEAWLRDVVTSQILSL